MKLTQQRYNSLAHSLKKNYGTRLHKVALDCGLGCPNRDGTVGSGGCIFCSEGGSGEFAGDAASPVEIQLHKAISSWRLHHPGQEGRFIAYYQAFTNTYASPKTLSELYRPALEHKDVALLDIATRPDCLDGDVMGVLRKAAALKPLWVELGLQTSHDHTAERINRGYPYSAFEKAVLDLRDNGIDVIVHLILGLPGETLEDVLDTVDAINRLPVQGVKLHLLHVLKGTKIALMYEEGLFETLTFDTYTDWICKCIARLRPDIVIHRLTGDGPKDLLEAPLWSLNKRRVLNEIQHRLKVLDLHQGDEYTKGLRKNERKQS